MHYMGPYTLYRWHSKNVLFFWTGNEINQRFIVIRAYRILTPFFVVRPGETTVEGAIAGEKDPSTSQEEGK